MNGQVFWVQIRALSLTNSTTFHIFIDEIKNIVIIANPFGTTGPMKKCLCVCVWGGRRWDKFHLIGVRS